MTGHPVGLIMFWKRLLFSYLFVSMSVLAILGLVVFKQINTSYKDQVIYSNEIILENGSKLLDDFISSMKKLTLEVAIHDEMQDYLVMFNTGKPMHTYNDLVEIVQRDQYLSSQLRRNNSEIRIYPIKHNLIFRYSPMTGAYLPTERTNDTENLYLAYEKNGGFIMESLYKPDGNSMVLSCVVFDMANWKTPVAVLELEIDAIAISSLLYNTKLERNISPYIIDGNDRVFLPYLDLQNFDEGLLEEFENEPVIVNGNILIKRQLINTDWKVVGVIPELDINRKISTVTKSFFITAIATGAAVILLSVYFALWLSRPLKKLAGRLRKFEEGEFKPLVLKRSYSSEVKTLYEQYNIMAARIDNLIKEVKVAADNEKEAELLALQAQINPHFLYNTLDSINWMALKYKAEDVRYMVNALANMMRYSLNSGRNVISVRDEIEQVRNYVGIQEIRHNGKFKTYFEVDEEIYDFIIIKLLLQPLVENAIRHGFMETGQYGEILIKGYIEEENLVFEVINEGDTINMDKIEALLHSQSDEKPRSYGIRNVNDRLIRQYGDEFELKFFVRDGYTHARIDIPLEMIGREDTDV